MSQTTPQVADTETIEDVTDAPRVRVVVTAVPGADLEAALAVVGRQVYEPSPEVIVVGDTADGVVTVASLDEAISGTDPSVDYLWLLHADARPRPDALSALVAEIERNEASLAGSKLLKAGTMDELESVGGATDVFGEPYSGLDEGEIDLQQYDVVREVAYVQSASMLVRRDLAQGLRGLDPLLPPIAAGLDFSQRTRLAGGRVISVPSSEVYHQGRCGEGGQGRREQAGRLRAMLTAYSPLTLLWVVPYDFLVSVVDSLVSLLMLRWRPAARHLYSWAWNIFHLPSTIKQRRRLHAVRSEGDEELFRFHAKGSVRLRSIGEEISGRALSLFDDDQALARGTRRVWGSPGIWGGILAVLVALFAGRAIVFGGVPNVGFSFPFEAPSVALQRWYSGWNESGLGAGAAVHPSVGLTGLFSFLWFGAEGAARTVATLGLVGVGIVGMGRLGGRLGLRGPGRYLAGLVVLAGPGTALLVGRGSWLALGAAALLPWAVRAAVVHPSHRGRLGPYGWALLTGGLLAFLSPVLALAPLLVMLLWRSLGGDRAGLTLGLVGAVGGIVGVAFVIGDPGWITDHTRSIGVEPGAIWPALVVLSAAPLFVAEDRPRSLALTGGILSLGALVVFALLPLGPGLEEATLVVASFGAALAVAVALDSLSPNVLRWIAGAAAIVVLFLSVVALGNGRFGLPAGDVNARLSFAETLSDAPDPGRILHVSADRELLPGEVRSGPGFWYRVLDGDGTTNDEVWLPAPRAGDEELGQALVDIASGAELRPGERLSSFAIGWVVLEGPDTALDDALVAQLDLVPVPLDPESRVYENHSASPIAGTAEVPWRRSGVAFSGDPVDGPVPLSVNYDEGWGPESTRSDWRVTVDGSTGTATFRPTGPSVPLAITSIAVVLLALGSIAIGRRRT
jgi:GT2 family glycosyltransferase